jgi:hydroxymethylpyrimidine/phosphomethylpyrimidine kinase
MKTIGDKIEALNTVGVQGVETLSPAFIAAQFGSLVSDIGVDTLEIGMLGTAAVVVSVAAMTAGLARGKTAPEAFAAAKQYAAISAAPGLGHGHGPLNHLVSPWDEPNWVKNAEDAEGLYHD